MLLIDDWHPFEIKRRLNCWKEAFFADFELRYPETRRRFAFELKNQLPSKDLGLFEDLISQFSTATRIISFFDWSILAEWNERLAQAQSLARISRQVPENIQSAGIEDPTIKIILLRLSEIRLLLRSQNLKEAPGLFDLIRYRWKFASIRQEAQYLVVRLQELLEPKASQPEEQNTGS